MDAIIYLITKAWGRMIWIVISGSWLFAIDMNVLLARKESIPYYIVVIMIVLVVMCVFFGLIISTIMNYLKYRLGNKN